MKTSMGQCLDMLTANSFKTKKLEKYTMENYTAIVKYKTAYYSFFLPVCLAMRMVRHHVYNNNISIRFYLI